MTITSVDEISDLFSGFCVDDSTKLWRASRPVAKHSACVGNYTHLNAAHSGMTGDNLFRVIGMELIQVPTIQQTIQHVTHVVRLAVIFWHDFVDIFRWRACNCSARIWSARILAGGSQASSLHSYRKLRNKLPSPGNRLFLIVHPIVCHASSFFV